MRNEIVNPLFESLMKRAEMYVHPSISEAGTSPSKGLSFAAYARTQIKIVQGFISDFSDAIMTYPPTAIARDFKKTFKTNLAAIGSKIDTVKTVDIQSVGIVNGISAEYDRFKAEIAKEKEYDPKIFAEWISYFDKMMEEEKTAIVEINKKMDEINKLEKQGEHPTEIANALQEYIKTFSEEIKESVYPKISYNSNSVLEYLSDNNICVDFKTYSKIVNEGIFDFVIGSKKDREANRNRKDLIIKTEALKSRLDSVMNRIAAARNDAGSKGLKILDKEATFNDIYKRINSIESKYGEGVDPKGVNFGEETKRLNDVTELFNNQLKEFDTEFAKQQQSSDDYSNVMIAVPTLKGHLDKATGSKNSLRDVSQQAQNNYKIKLSTDAAAAAEAAKKKKEEEKPEVTGSGKSDLQIKEPIKQGSKDKENIKKFQQLVVDKMKSLKGKKPYDNLAASSGQFGNFGNKTAAVVKYLKSGFKMKDKSSDITQELIDKISSDDGKINDSLLINEEFDVKAADASLVGSSSGSEKSGGTGGGSKVNSSAFKCIKAKEGKDFKMKGGKAVLNRDSGNIHEFKADGSYKIFIKSEDKWKKGVWSCAGGSYEATIEGGEVYLGDYQDFKSSVTKAQKAAADAASKKAAEFAARCQEICKPLLYAMSGATEDEELVYKTFKESITSKEIFLGVEYQWNSVWPSKGDLNGTLKNARGLSWDQIKQKCSWSSGKMGFSFRAIFPAYFSSSELTRLNQYLPAGISAF